MKRINSFIFSLLCLGLLNAQSNVKITYSNAIALNIKQLESDTPKVVKKHTMERIQNIRFLSYMTIEDELVYYEIKSKSIDNKESEKIATSTTKYYMVPSIQINIPEEKYLKNNKENSIASYVDKKLQSEKLPSITWKKSSKQKYKGQNKGHAACVQSFLSSLKQGEECPIPFEESYLSTLATFKALQSISENRKIVIEPIQ